MDLRGVSTIADYFVIATGTSQPQLAALAKTAEETLIAHGLILSHTEGINAGNWVLLDFGSVIVHLFDGESRQFYNLERVWGDAKVTQE
jgi:ribosome-associated protein